ncbi:MAG: nucleotidyltransferase domain-containing protein [Planctomycetota bacterium]
MKTLNASKREMITTILTKVLNSEESVIFAYLYGSFVTDNLFRDIDIFIFTRKDEDSFVYPVSVKEKLCDAVTKAGIDSFVVDDYDVRIINDAPYDIMIDILRDGRLIVDKAQDLRKDYIERISDEYRVNYFILDEAYGADR